MISTELCHECRQLKTWVMLDDLEFWSCLPCKKRRVEEIRSDPAYVRKHLRSEYSSWCSSRNRCNNPNNPLYFRYGGDNIKFSKLWDRFIDFYSDMGKKPSPFHSLDRYPKQDGNYDPSNCRWATATEQSRNRKNNHLILYKNQLLTMAEVAEKENMVYQTLSNRVRKGLTGDDLHSPLRSSRKYNFDGLNYSIGDLAGLTNIDIHTLYYRLEKLGLAVDEAVDPNFQYKTRGKQYQVNGELLTLSQIHKKFNIPLPTLEKRARMGFIGNDLINNKKEMIRYFYQGKNRTIPEIAALVGISAVTIRNRLKKGISPENAFSKPLGYYLGKAMRQNANAKGQALPCDQIEVPDPNNPGRTKLVNPPGWKNYDVED